LRLRRLFQSKAPLALAGLLAVPLYLAALLASSLALDKPRLVGTHEHPPSSGAEAKVWAAALIVPAILLAVGTAALPLRRFGTYLPAAAGIVVCLVLPSLSNGWIARHERRFPFGIDFVPDSSTSNLSSRGEWEHAAQSTITSITHWTLVLAIGAIVVGVLLELRRRRGGDAILVEPPPLEAATGGAPGITG
jgi:energy-converting hydrogenase Eha subunit A